MWENFLMVMKILEEVFLWAESLCPIAKSGRIKLLTQTQINPNLGQVSVFVFVYTPGIYAEGCI